MNCLDNSHDHRGHGPDHVTTQGTRARSSSKSRIRQERCHRGEPELHSLSCVTAFGVHPSQPGFQLLPIEMLEADLAAVNMLLLGEIPKERFQTDPVRLDLVLGDRPLILGM